MSGPGLEDHKRGRCTRLTVPKSWRELAFDINEPGLGVPDARAVFDDTSGSTSSPSSPGAGSSCWSTAVIRSSRAGTLRILVTSRTDLAMERVGVGPIRSGPSGPYGDHTSRRSLV